MVNDPSHPVGATYFIQAGYADPTPAELIAFLNGEGPLEGRWFGRGGVPAYWWRHYLPLLSAPIPMVLHCPRCGALHVDGPSPGWDNPPHRSHLCDVCGCIWRPADVATVGVRPTELKTAGAADNWLVERVERVVEGDPPYYEYPEPGGGSELYEGPLLSPERHLKCSHALGGSSANGTKGCVFCGDVFDAAGRFVRATR